MATSEHLSGYTCRWQVICYVLLCYITLCCLIWPSFVVDIYDFLAVAIRVSLCYWPICDHVKTVLLLLNFFCYFIQNDCKGLMFPFSVG